MAILAVLLLSNRFRQRIGRFVSRHFKRPKHDFHQSMDPLYPMHVQRAGRVQSVHRNSQPCEKFLKPFNVLSVTIWRFDKQKRLAASKKWDTSWLGRFSRSPQSPSKAKQNCWALSVLLRLTPAQTNLISFSADKTCKRTRQVDCGQFLS